MGEWMGEYGEQELSPAFVGANRALGSELRRLAACAGGVALPRLFPSEPLEQLRRWTRPVVCHGATPREAEEILSQRRGLSQNEPHVEVLAAQAAVDEL